MAPVQDPVESKPAVQSTVIWTLAALAVPYLSDAFTYLGQLPPGTFPHPVSLGITGIGYLFLLYKRLYGDNKPISGVVMQQGPVTKP
jgi:hypothetical protein